MARLPLSHAETLAVVVEEGTMDAAARRLRITPSAVSQRISALEAQLGQVLLVRGRPARATPAGQSVVRWAREVALLEHDALDELGVDGAATTSVAIAVNADSLATWLLPALVALTATHPVVVDLRRADEDDTADLLTDGSVLAAVTTRRTPVSGCRSLPLGTMVYEAVAERAFAERWFGGAAVTRETLERAPVVDFDRRDDLQTRWLEAHGADAARPPRHYVPASVEFARAIIAGMGWGLLPRSQSGEALADGRLVALGGTPARVPLYWQHWNLRSPLVDALTSAVRAAASVALDQV